MASKYDLMINIGGKLNSSLTNATSGANKALSGMQRTANVLKTAVVGALGYVSIRSAVNFGKSCVTAAETSENAMTQLKTVLESTKGVSGMTVQSATNIAKSLSSVTTYSKSTVIGTENLLLTFTKIGSDIMPQVTEAALNMSTALGTDSSTSAMQLGKALNNPAAGLSKLMRAGVSFTEEQKNQIIAMQKAGDLAGAQKLMLKELETEFGNSARAAGNTSEGQKIRIKNAMTSIKASIGTKLLPVIDKISSSISDHLPQIMDTVDKIMQHIQPVIDLVENKIVPGVVNVFQNVLIPVVKGVYDAVKSVIDFIKEHQTLFETIAIAVGVVAAAFVAWQVIMVAFWGVFNAFRIAMIAWQAIMAINPVVLIIVGIVALVAAFVVLWNKCAAFRNFWINLWAGIKKVFSTVVNAISGFFKKWGSLVLLFVAPIIGIPLLIIKHWDSIKTFFSGVWDGIKNVFSAVGAWFSGIFTGAWNGIKTAFSAVGSFFSGIWDTIKSTFTSIGTTIGNAIGGAFKTVVNAIIGFAENTINGFIASIDLAIGLINKIPNVNIPMIKMLEIPRLEKGGIIKHGNGGILANIGEGRYDEAVVPLKSKSSLGGGTQISYAPQITIQGNASRSDVDAAIAASFEQFKVWYAKMKADERRKAFAPT